MRILITLLFGTITAASAHQARPRPVTWSLWMLDTPPAGAPALVRVAVLHARIDPGWHLYSLTQPAGGARATRIEIVGDPPFRLAGPIERPAPDTIPDANFGIMSEVYDDSVTFRLPVAANSQTLRGRSRLLVAVTYQACSSRLCLPPRTDSVGVPVRPTR